MLFMGSNDVRRASNRLCEFKCLRNRNLCLKQNTTPFGQWADSRRTECDGDRVWYIIIAASARARGGATKLKDLWYGILAPITRLLSV